MNIEIGAKEIIESALCVCGGLASRELMKQAFDNMEIKSLKLQIGRRVLETAMFIGGVGMVSDICKRVNSGIEAAKTVLQKNEGTDEEEAQEEVEED